MPPDAGAARREMGGSLQHEERADPFLRHLGQGCEAIVAVLDRHGLVDFKESMVM